MLRGIGTVPSEGAAAAAAILSRDLSRAATDGVRCGGVDVERRRKRKGRKRGRKQGRRLIRHWITPVTV